MIGVLTHHWAKENCLLEARALLDRNGQAQAQAPGFLSRTTLYSTNDSTQITTLVLWDNNEIYDVWKASPERTNIMEGAERFWSTPPSSERFEVADLPWELTGL